MNLTLVAKPCMTIFGERKKILEEYETKLHLLEAYQARNHQADRIQQYVRKNYQDDAELNELVNNLETLEE